MTFEVNVFNIKSKNKYKLYSYKRKHIANILSVFIYKQLKIY